MTVYSSLGGIEKRGGTRRTVKNISLALSVGGILINSSVTVVEEQLQGNEPKTQNFFMGKCKIIPLTKSFAA